MAIKIGHASKDENGNIIGGVAGDQTGKEVCIRNYYMHSKGWYLFRFILVAHAIAMAEAMHQACNNPFIGYDQGERLNIMTALKKYGSLEKIEEPTECDCSSLIRACIFQATGVDLGNFNTASEPQILEKSGLFENKVSVTESTEICDGDIMVTKTKGHTVAAVEGNPRKERTAKGDYKMNTLKRGYKGSDVTVFESIMKKLGYYDGEIDKSFGPKCEAACNKFQEDYPECGTKGKPDSSWGPKCWRKVLELITP